MSLSNAPQNWQHAPKPVDGASLPVNETPYEDAKTVNKAGKILDNPNSKVTEMTQEKFERRLAHYFNWHVSGVAKSLKQYQNAAELYGGVAQFKNLLHDISNAVFSDPEFQRGTVDYNRMYEKAWNIYKATVGEYLENLASEGNRLADEVLARIQRPPGIYHDGELKLPIFFSKYAKLSDNGAANMRRAFGVSQSPAQARLQKEMSSTLRGYGQAWSKNFLKENGRDPTKQELESMAQNYLQWTDNDKREFALGDQQHAGFGHEEKSAKSLDMTVDHRYQAEVLQAMRQGMAIPGLTSERFTEKTNFYEVQPEDAAKNIPQVVSFKSPAAMQDGREVPDTARKGLIRIERSPADPLGDGRQETKVRVLEFTDVDQMLIELHDTDKDTNDLYTSFMRDEYNTKFMQDPEPFEMFVTHNVGMPEHNRTPKFYNQFGLFGLVEIYRTISPLIRVLEPEDIRELDGFRTWSDARRTKFSENVKAYLEAKKPTQSEKNILRAYLNHWCPTPNVFDAVKDETGIGGVESDVATV